MDSVASQTEWRTWASEKYSVIIASYIPVRWYCPSDRFWLQNSKSWEHKLLSTLSPSPAALQLDSWGVMNGIEVKAEVHLIRSGEYWSRNCNLKLVFIIFIDSLSILTAGFVHSLSELPCSHHGCCGNASPQAVSVLLLRCVGSTDS